MTTKRKPYFQDNRAFTKKLYYGRETQKNGPVPGRYWITRRRDVLLKIIFGGKIKGKRGPGRRQRSWFRNIRNWCCFLQQKRTRCALCDKHMYAYTLH